MPYKNEGRSNYPKGFYFKPENTASDNWLQSIPQNLSQNTVVKEIQSINEFNSFYPMEVIATEEERTELITKNQNKGFIVFPEDRMYPIKMKDRIPFRWVNKNLSSFSGQADKGEYFAYQLGVYALDDLENLTVCFSDLRSNNGAVIPAKNSSCINNSGIDYTGKSFDKNVSVASKNVQAMWCLIDVPQNAKAGLYKGKAFVSAKGLPAETINIAITVTDKTLVDGGISEPWKQTRLKWLNSTLAQDNTVIAPYTPLAVKNNSVSLLGRRLELNSDGFPAQLQTFFTQEMTGYQTQPNNILSAPIHFIISDKDGKNIEWKSSGPVFTKKEAGAVQWSATNTSTALLMKVAASFEFDGFISYTVKLTALKDVQLKDIALQIPFNKTASKYMMGLGRKGGYRPDNFKWKWEVATKNQDGAWIGNVNAGLQYSLRDEKYIRPLNTNFYLQKPLLLPSS